jgi:hypothetical protein
MFMRKRQVVMVLDLSGHSPRRRSLPSFAATVESRRLLVGHPRAGRDEQSVAQRDPTAMLDLVVARVDRAGRRDGRAAEAFDLVVARVDRAG